VIDDTGIFRTTISLSPLTRPGDSITLENVMVDTDAEFSAVPREILEDIGIPPVAVERFEAADGRVFEREIGFVLLTAGGRTGPTVVMFANNDDMTLLGAHGLEALRLRIDLARKELVPAGPAPAAVAVVAAA